MPQAASSSNGVVTIGYSHHDTEAYTDIGLEGEVEWNIRCLLAMSYFLSLILEQLG